MSDRLVFGNIDYRGHTSDEGDQLQRGLEHAGWTIVGAGYGDGCRDARELLERYQPRIVFVHDKRDWSPDCSGAFRKDIGFENLEALRAANVERSCVLKDAGSIRHYQRRFCQEIGAQSVVIYYHERAVRALNPWLQGYRLVRTYHSVDRVACDAIPFRLDRKRAVITGATSAVYPLREKVMKHALSQGQRDLEVFGHPGYHNRGHHTPEYLAMLSGYRVHVATCSIYGFALRKIIESVAMGCAPVTNLPAYDRLPEIDGALVRVSPKANAGDVMDAVADADRQWNADERTRWAAIAREWYDWRRSGLRLAAELAAEEQLEEAAR